MASYDSLVARHEKLRKEFDDDPDSIGVDSARQLIEETRSAGREVVEIPQRQQLRTILRYWGNVVHDRTGDYPNTHLLPFGPNTPSTANEQPQQPQQPPPAAGGETTANGGATVALVPVAEQSTNRGATGDRPSWFWPILGAVVIAAVALAFMASAAWNRLTNSDRVEATGVAEVTVASPTVELPVAAGDSDADGLSDGQETLLGTEITSADTDGDGLLDGEEVLVYGTNPAATDSDGDGMSDGSEVAQGSPPTDPGGFNPPVADPVAPITATETITVTTTPALPPGPVLIVTAAEGQPAVPIRTGPGERYAVVVDVPDGSAVLLVRRVPDNSWYSIELAGGTRGWLPAGQATVPETTNVAAVPTFVPPQQ